MLKDGFKNIKRTFGLAWAVDRICIVSMTIASLCAAALVLIGLLLSSYCIEALSKTVQGEVIIRNVIIGVIFMFILTICGKYASRIKEAHIFHTESELNSKINEKNYNMDYELLEDPEVQHIKIRMAQDRNWGWGIVSFYWNYNDLICCIFKIIMSFVIILPLFSWSMLKRNPIFVTMVLLLIAICIIISIYTCMVSKQKIAELMDAKRPANLYHYVAFDKGLNYNNGKDLRIYRGDKLFNSHFIKENEAAVKDSMRFGKYMGQASRNNSMIKGLIMCGSYFAVIIATIKGSLTIGSMVRYAGAIYIICENISTFINTFFELILTCNRQQSIVDYLNYPNKMHKGTLPVEKMYFCENGDNDYEIEFKNVYFKYPNSDVYALEDICFKFKVGEKLAMVGMNGSGKTTIIKLMCRMYDPTNGEILLNGVNIQNYDYDEYMSIFGIVFQDFKLLSFTLGQNLSCNCDYDSKKALAALEKAGFKERLETMDKGLETCLYNDFDSGNGVEISGGEAQKIALARALYKNAPFIILDEPTAALDPVAEYDIYSRFNKIVGDKTAIYISHRLSSCRFCDSIVVFHKGKIIQRGSHEELLEDKGGKYYELWNAQAKYYVV